MQRKEIGLLGASSFVGRHLIDQATGLGHRLTPVSRRPRPGTAWRTPADMADTPLTAWISVAPIWATLACCDQIEASGARRLVALSSTSRFTKITSTDDRDARIAERLAQSEDGLAQWATSTGITLVILRPTLIYGDGADRNIAEIARVIRRFGFFPILGRGDGLRQPIHAWQVADAALRALDPRVGPATINITGGETLAYIDLVRRVFTAMGRRPVVPRLPRTVLAGAIAMFRQLPRYRHWSVSMAERMDTDMVFDPEPARRLLGFAPGPFVLSPSDIPS